MQIFEHIFLPLTMIRLAKVGTWSRRLDSVSISYVQHTFLAELTSVLCVYEGRRITIFALFGVNIKLWMSPQQLNYF